MDIDVTCATIRAVYRDMQFYMKQRIRAENALKAYIRVNEGWSPDLPKKESDRIKTLANALVDCGRAVRVGRKAKLSTSKEFKRYFPEIDSTLTGTAVFEAAEDGRVRELERLAMTLPVWQSFAKNVKGIGVKSLGVIVGEAGNLSAYATEGKLQKRLCLAVIDGCAQGKPGPDASAQTWIKHGYKPTRRAAMFVIGDNLIRQKNERYYGHYQRRKEYEIAKAKSAGLLITSNESPRPKDVAVSQCRSMKHIHYRSHRFMTQKFVRDLYRAWLRIERERLQSPPVALPVSITKPVKRKTVLKRAA